MASICRRDLDLACPCFAGAAAYDTDMFSFLSSPLEVGTLFRSLPVVAAAHTVWTAKHGKQVPNRPQYIGLGYLDTAMTTIFYLVTLIEDR